FLDRGQPETRDLLQPPPAARHARFLFGYEGGIELLLGERALADHRHELRIDDELCQGGVTADVPLAQNLQFFRRHLAAHVAGVEVGPGDPFHLTATDFTQVTLLAQCHAVVPKLATTPFGESKHPVNGAHSVLTMTSW